MIQSLEALIDENGSVGSLEKVHLSSHRRPLVTILEQPISDEAETALLNEATLAVNWARSQEDEAWIHLR